MEQGLLQGPWTRRPTSLAADRGRRFGSSASGHDPVTGLPDRRALFNSRGTAGSSPFGLAALGKETELQRRELEGMGVPLSQGYLFSRPLRAADTLAFILEDLRR